ncbi:MAG: cytochrome b/b6 domain-containing protein [Cyanobacteria bacterium J06636_16]
MKPNQLYQPFLLRLLHGLTGLFLIAAMLTAFWTYTVYDGRWGSMPLPTYPEVEGIHGTFGLWTLLIFPVFVLYAFHRGQQRLVQPDAIAKLTQIGKPIWWYTLNRCINTLALLALTFALCSGKMMDETWLPKGELEHRWYYIHLISWVVMAGAIALHLLMNAKVGGAPLLQSMLTWRFREIDSPKLWPTHVATWWSNIRLSSRTKKSQSANILKILEAVILASLVAAWIISFLKYL